MDDTSRWVQLTYSSFDREQGPGGWQVKDLTGNPSDDEYKLAQTSVVTGFDFHGETATYPSAEEIASWPRRFSFIQTPSGGLFVHAVKAGRDSTGRPGNTYSHVVLDRNTTRSSKSDYLPIDLWRSAAFDVPYGVQEILETEVAASPISLPGPFAGAATALSIMTMPGYREPLLAALDALETIQHRKGMLVLVTDRQDWAALIISAISRLTSPGTTRSLSFSLYERAEALSRLRTAGIAVVAIPRADLEDIDPASATFVLVDGEIPETNTDEHIVAHGAPIPRTEFSRMVEAIIGDPDNPDLELLTSVVTGLSESSLEVNQATIGVDSDEDGYFGLDEELEVDDVNNLDLAWPLAMFIRARNGHLFPAEASSAAGVLVMRSSPISIGRSAKLLPSVREVVAGSLAGSNDEQNRLGHNTGRIWTALEELSDSRSPLTSALLEHAYLLEAITDEQWLDSGAAPAGIGAWMNLDDGGELREATRRALRSAESNCSNSGYRPDFELKLLTFLSRVSLIDDARRPLDEESEHLVDSILGSSAVRNFVNGHDIPDLSGMVDVAVRDRLLAHIRNWDPPGCSYEFGQRIAAVGPRDSWLQLYTRDVESFSRFDVLIVLELVRQQGARAADGGPPIDPVLLESSVRAAPVIHVQWGSVDHKLVTIIEHSVLSLETLQFLEKHSPGWLPETGPMMHLLGTQPWSDALSEYLGLLQRARGESIPLANLRVTAGDGNGVGGLRSNSKIVDEVRFISRLNLSAKVTAELAPVVWCAIVDFAGAQGLNQFQNATLPTLPDVSRFPLSDPRTVLSRAEFLWSHGKTVLCSVQDLAKRALFASDQRTRMGQADTVNRVSGRRKSAYSLEQESWPFPADYLTILGAETAAGDSLLTLVLSRLAQTTQGAFLTERIDDNNSWFRSVEGQYELIVRQIRETEADVDTACNALFNYAEKWRKTVIKAKLKDPDRGRKAFSFTPGRARPVEAMKVEGEK